MSHALGADITHHSRSLYMIVKKTCRKRLTAFMRTASRYNHASPDILTEDQTVIGSVQELADRESEDVGEAVECENEVGGMWPVMVCAEAGENRS